MSQAELFAEVGATPPPDAIVSEIQKQGYANLPFNLGHAATAELFRDFKLFIDLCNEPGGDVLEDAVRYTAHELGNGKYFLEHRTPGVNVNETDRPPGNDLKYVYHFGPRTIAHARAALGGAMPTEMQTFLEHCDQFYTEGSRALRAGAAALGLERILFSEVREEEVHHLRLIDYLATGDPTLGEGHFDRSVLTAALNESSSGLEGTPGQNGFLEPITVECINELFSLMQPVHHTEYTAKVFAGAGLNRLPQGLRDALKDIPLFAHMIKNNHPGERRQAVVLFGNPTVRYPFYTVPDSRTETGLNDISAHLARQAA